MIISFVPYGELVLTLRIRRRSNKSLRRLRGWYREKTIHSCDNIKKYDLIKIEAFTREEPE